jgi:hypothetical protein
VEVNPGDLALLALGCACLCGVGFLLVTGLQVVSGFLGIFSSVIEVFFEVLSGGPVAWCGCLVLLGVCGGGTILVVILVQGLSSCGTPQAINFCALFGQ